jgi:hypothetical protein
MAGNTLAELPEIPIKMFEILTVRFPNFLAVYLRLEYELKIDLMRNCACVPRAASSFQYLILSIADGR